MKLVGSLDTFIEYSFYFLLFTVPLVLTPWNYELFEFNKMMLVYAMTVVIVGAWIGKWIVEGKIKIQRTPLDIPILIFFASQLASTIFSIDIHTSIWGYYSRFHGGLLSTISYILLYYAFVTNMVKSQKSKVKSQKYDLKFKNNQNQPTINPSTSRCGAGNQQLTINCIYLLLASAALITFYGILEHFGIDASFWVQDVRNRVFSTLGQPNWLGAWIDGIIFIPLAFILKEQILNFKDHQFMDRKSKIKNQKSIRQMADKIKNFNFNFSFFIFYSLFTIFYFCLLFTGSRSAFFGFLAALVAFLSLLVFSQHPRGDSLKKTSFLLVSFLFVLFSFLYEWKKIPLFKFTALGLFGFSLALLQLKGILHPSTSLRPELRPRGSGLRMTSGDKQTLKIINILLVGMIIISLWFGTPISPSLSKFLKNLQLTTNHSQPITHNPQPITLPRYLISESSDIRKVVWKGALDVWRNWPILGSGVETFAYSYYNFRPRAHNDLSEWDFLYNKAHNEYLNYLATTGIVGLGSYLLLIGWFFIWTIKKMWDVGSGKFDFEVRSENFRFRKSKYQNIPLRYPASHFPLLTSLLAGYASILVTNFFGFSVVPVALLFWLFPAFAFVLTNDSSKTVIFQPRPWSKNDSFPKYFLLFLLFAICYLLFALARFWWADFCFAQGKKYAQGGYLLQAHQQLLRAVQLNKNEALFHSILGENAAAIAAVYQQKEATEAATIVDQFSQLATSQTQETFKLNKVHLNYYKTAAKTYIYLGHIQSHFYQNALDTLETAARLSPTDAKIFFNLAILYQQLDQADEALKNYEKTAELKPDYTQAHLTLARFYHQIGQKDKAKGQLEFILTQIDADQEEAKGLLEKWNFTP